MAIALTPTQDDIDVALRSWLLSVLPPVVPVVKMQVNRVPEPQATDFVVTNEVVRVRLATNIDSWVDVALTGTIAGTLLTAADVTGTMVPGLPLSGAGLAAGTTLGQQQSGQPGGAGTYLVAPAQDAGPTLVQGGTRASLQKTEMVMQVDVHGDAAGDNAQVISTLFRDEVGVNFFRDLPIDMQPLWASDPRQLPFINAEQQWETRYSVDLHFEANQVVSNVPQQFADQLIATLHNVEAAYPA